MLINTVANLVLEIQVNNETHNYSKIITVYNFGDIYLLYNDISNTNTYIEFTNSLDINSFLSDYIDTFENEDNIDKAILKIMKNGSVFISKTINIDETLDVDDDETYAIKYHFDKFIKNLVNIDKDYNLRIYEILYKSNDLIKLLPHEIIDNIIKFIQ